MTVYTLFAYIALVAIALTAVLGVGHSKLKHHQVTHPLVWFIQYFMGSLLIFSGLVKGVDPVGTAYKMKDYFTEFEIQGLPFMDVMQEYALPFSLIMLVLELFLGAALILGLGQRKTTWMVLLMMLFFTFLTGFNYLTGYTSKPDEVGFLEFDKWGAFADENIRITDCGCFGDFLKLKPVETFVKDIIYTILGLMLVFNTTRLKELLPREGAARTVAGVLLIGASTWFCLQNFYLDKPMVDFRPFYVGADLNKAKEECAANPPKVETYYTYVHQETKEEKEILAADFSKAENKYLWEQGSPWKIDSDRTRSKTLKEGCTSQVQYFDKFEVLEDKQYNFLVIGGDLDKADKDAFKKISALAAQAENDGYATRALYYHTSKQTLDEFRQEVTAAYPFDTADDKLLKTIIRAKPGLLLLKDGVVIQKWHHRHIPNYADVKGEYMK